jgi:large subunit ribosomal protein L19
MANSIKWQEKVTFSIGDTIKVSTTVKEGDKTRTQFFQGIVIAIRGTGTRKNFIVRKIGAGGIGIEKIFPVETPTVTGIEVIKQGKVRRAKLYYLRDLVGKKATKIKDVFVKKDKTQPVVEKIEKVVEEVSSEPEVEEVASETEEIIKE